MDYVELLCKTNFTFLTGASHPEELIDQAVKLGLKGLAINDRNGVYGMPKAYKRARLNEEFKFIVGSEVTIQNRPSITFLTQDRKAYGLLCRMLTASHAQKEKGTSFLTWLELLAFLNRPEATGLIALPQDSSNTDYQVFYELFQDRLYLPLTKYLDGQDEERTQRILKIQKIFGAKIIATNDVYFHVKNRKALHDTVTAIRETQDFRGAGYKLFSNAERYLKSPRQISHLYKDFPEALTNTLEVAERCKFSPKELRYRYPSEWIPAGHSAQSYLEENVWEGAKQRYGEYIPEDVTKQLNHELALIEQLSFADYFLTIFDIVEFARSRKILCQGRGSAANSTVCFVLGITAIDPVRTKLLFERFISAERGEPPDIDVDFEHERREEVIQYIYEKYGRDRAGMVSAIVTYQGRSAFREVCKAFGVPVGTLSAKKVERRFIDLTKNMKTKSLREKISKITEEIQGFPRHISIHSGGFTLSADPLIEIVPIEPAKMEGRTIVQWDKYDLDILGLLKVDLLCLGMLSAVRKTLDLVGMKFYEIPSEDSRTYKMIQEADTVGTFQVESRAQMQMLGRLLPETFYDLVIQVAIVRPGPIVGKMIHPYLKRRRGIEKIDFPHPIVKDILGKTLGIPLFQEQIMALAIKLADFTPGEADELRRSIAAWRSSASIAKMAARLMAGLLKSGLPKSFADQIFEQIQGFSHYGFPESHAASFALIAYASCYLKCHHPAEFLCGLINSQPMGFYSVHTLVFDAQRHGVKVIAVNPNHSQWDCEIIKDGSVQLGLRVVVGLAKKDADHLLKERSSRPFKNLGDFLTRCQLRRDVLLRLAMGDAFRDFGLQPRDALWGILQHHLLLESHKSPQLSLFGSINVDLQEGKHFRVLSDFETIQEDYSTFNLSTHGHPMGVLRGQMQRIPKCTAIEATEKPTGSKITICGLVVVRQRPPTANGVMFSTLEDETGFLDLVFWKDVADKSRETFLNHSFVIISGKIEKDRNTTALIVDNVKPLWDEPTYETTPLPVEAMQFFH